MKKLLILVLSLFICGCTSKYTLEISNDSFKENIDVVINKNEIPTKTHEDIELDDQITPFLKDKTKVFKNDEKEYYKKIVKYEENIITVNMKYNYTAKEFLNSNTLNTCFENKEFIYNEEYYIHVSGVFYCLYTPEIEISIKTDNTVKKHNADKVEGNIYTWIINDKNVNNVDIEISIDKGLPSKKIFLYSIVIFTILVVSVIVVSILYTKNRQENSI